MSQSEVGPGKGSHAASSGVAPAVPAPNAASGSPSNTPSAASPSPQPYYEDALVTLYHGDARELLSGLQADLMLTDPPYANGTAYASYSDDEAGLRSLIDALFPLVATRALITPGVANMHLYPRPRWTLAWVTPAGAGSGPWGFSCWQPVLAYGSDPYLAESKGRQPDTYVRTETSAPSEHPCAKPIDVWRWMLMRGSLHTSDVILDPFAGSGTTLRAAKDCGRKVIGIELEERYCEIAAEKCAQESLPLSFSLNNTAEVTELVA